MELKKEAKYFKKEWVHRCYSRIIEDFKDYDKITRSKIIDEVIRFYSNPQNIINLCSYKELKILEKVLNKKEKIKKAPDKDSFEYIDLRDKFLLCNFLYEDICIPEELKKHVRKALKEYNKNELIKRDKLNDILIGLLKIYGILEFIEFYEIVSNYLEIDLEDFIKFVDNDKYLHFYSYPIYLEDESYIVYEPYYYLEEELLDVVNNSEIPITIRPLDEVIYLRYHQFDDRVKSIKAFLEEVYTLTFFHYSLFEEIEYFVQLDMNRESLITSFRNIPILKNRNLDYVVDLMNKAMDDMPSIILRGATKNEFKEDSHKIKYDQVYDKNYENLKNDKSLKEYKKIREKVSKVIDECNFYAFETNRLSKFYDFIRKDEICFDFDDMNAVVNLVVFHSVDNEKSIFEEYFKEKISILHKDNSLFSQIKNSYKEGLFVIKKLNPKTGKVVLENYNSKETYEICDVALSCASKNIINSYIYTSLITVNNYTFSTDYGFVFIKEKHKDIISDIEKKRKKLKNIKNEKTKDFMACYILFKEEDVIFTQKVLN